MSKLKPGHSQFDQGILFAVAMLNRLHDQPSMCADVLKCCDLSNADVSKLDEFDQQPLIEVARQSDKIKLTGFSEDLDFSEQPE